MRAIFHPEAELELMDATCHYDASREGLGDEFATAGEARVDEFTRDPSSWPVIEHSVRRARVLRFPYDVVFAETDEAIVILAVMHHHRRPGYWFHRVREIDLQ